MVGKIPQDALTLSRVCLCHFIIQMFVTVNVNVDCKIVI